MSIYSDYQYQKYEPPYSPDPLIEDGILLPNTVMMMFGAAGSWKTMNVFNLAYSIANGSPWFGYETKQATIFGQQVELPEPIHNERCKKFKWGNNTYSKNVFWHTPKDDMFLDTTVGIEQLRKHIDEVKRRAPDDSLPTLAILDPLYMYMSGDISNSYDVQKFQRNVNRIRRDLDVTFVIVHHSRLTRVNDAGEVVDLGSEELIGSSYWNNWLDTILRMKVTNPFAGANQIRMEWGKTRNAQNFVANFTVKWNRYNLVPEVIERDLIEDDEPTIRDLIG